jgi:hypothetical protein
MWVAALATVFVQWWRPRRLMRAFGPSFVYNGVMLMIPVHRQQSLPIRTQDVLRKVVLVLTFTWRRHRANVILNMRCLLRMMSAMLTGYNQSAAAAADCS